MHDIEDLETYVILAAEAVADNLSLQINDYISSAHMRTFLMHDPKKSLSSVLKKEAIKELAKVFVESQVSPLAYYTSLCYILKNDDPLASSAKEMSEKSVPASSFPEGTKKYVSIQECIEYSLKNLEERLRLTRIMAHGPNKSNTQDSMREFDEIRSLLEGVQYANDSGKFYIIEEVYIKTAVKNSVQSLAKIIEDTHAYLPSSGHLVVSENSLPSELSKTSLESLVEEKRNDAPKTAAPKKSF